MSGFLLNEAAFRSAAKVVLAAGGAAMLAGCLSGGPQTRRVDYRCERGPGLTVVFQRNTARVLRPGGVSLELWRRPTGSGFWFESAGASLRGSRRQVVFTEGRAAPVRCWEIARR